MGCRCSTRDGFISYGAVGRWGGGNGRGGGGGVRGWRGRVDWAEVGGEGSGEGGCRGKVEGWEVIEGRKRER